MGSTSHINSQSPAPDDSKISAYRWVVIGTLTAATSLGISNIFVLGIMLPDMAEDLGLSPSKQGLLGSSSLITQLLLSIPINNLVSRFRPWRLASLGIFGIAGFVLLQAQSPVFAVLITARIGLAFAVILSQAPRTLIIQQWSTPRQLAPTYGAFFAGIDVAFGIAFFLTPQVMAWTGGWRSTLNIWAAVAVVGGLAWMVLGRERVTTRYRQSVLSQDVSPLRTLLRYRELWFAAIGLFGIMLAETAFNVFWPTFAQDELHLSATTVGIGLGLGAIAAAPGSVGVNLVPFLLRHRVGVVLVCGLVKFSCLIGLLYLDSPTHALMLNTVRGLFSAYLSVLMIMVFFLPRMKPREITVAQAFLRTAIFSGAALGPLLVGFVQEATDDLQMALLITAFFSLALVVSSFLLRGARLSDSSDPPA